MLSKYRVPTMQNRLGDLTQPPYKKSFYHQGFFAVKRRAVFILGAKWIALVRGWRRDCVVGGMETRFQWRKAHSRTAKCEAFHIAPRLFFMFLFLIPFTIRQQFTIYSFEFSTDLLRVAFETCRRHVPTLWWQPVQFWFWLTILGVIPDGSWLG